MTPEDQKKVDNFLSELDKLGTNLDIIGKELRKKKIQSLENILFIYLMQITFHLMVILAISFNNYFLRIAVCIFALLYLLVYLYVIMGVYREYNEIKQQDK